MGKTPHEKLLQSKVPSSAKYLGGFVQLVYVVSLFLQSLAFVPNLGINAQQIDLLEGIWESKTFDKEERIPSTSCLSSPDQSL